MAQIAFPRVAPYAQSLFRPVVTFRAAVAELSKQSALALLFLVTIFSFMVRPASAIQSIADVKLLGVKLGMSQDEVIAIVSDHFGRTNVSISRVPCLKDALRALGDGESNAPADCIVAVRGRSSGEWITVAFVEALADHAYGKSVAWAVTIGVEKPKTNEDVAAFWDHALRVLDLGPESHVQSGGMRSWGIAGYPMPVGVTNVDLTSVAWGRTPYDSYDCFSVGPAQERPDAPQYSATVFGLDGVIGIAAPNLAFRHYQIFRDRVAQPTVQYNF